MRSQSAEGGTMRHRDACLWVQTVHRPLSQQHDSRLSCPASRWGRERLAWSDVTPSDHMRRGSSRSQVCMCVKAYIAVVYGFDSQGVIDRAQRLSVESERTRQVSVQGFKGPRSGSLIHAMAP